MTTLTFAPRQLFQALAQVKLACAKDDTLPALTVISARAEGTSLHLVATDRYRAHYAHVELEDAVQPVDFTLPASAVADLKSMRWNAKRGGPLVGTVRIAPGDVYLSAPDTPEIRYPRPDFEYAALDATYGVTGMLAQAITETEKEDRPSVMQFNPAYMADLHRAARLAASSHVSVVMENLSSRAICRLSDDSTRFRALVMGIRQVESEDSPHGEAVDGLDRLGNLGRPSDGHVTPPSFRTDGSTERAKAREAQATREPVNA